MKHRASLPLQDGRPWQTQGTNGRVSVRLSLRWSLALKGY